MSSRGVTTAVNQPLSVFLNPELIHTGKRVRPFGLERVPAIEIAHEMVAAEDVPITLHRLRAKFETDEFQVVLADEGLDLRNRHSTLLDMKQQVAALAGAEEIAGLGDAVERRIEQVLPAATDVVRGGAIALLDNEGAGGNDVTARELAVEAHMHEAARPQQRQQDAPACHRFRKVMQYPAGLDQIERSLDRSKLEDVGLSVLDFLSQRRRRLPFGVAKAGKAEIHGQDPRVAILARNLDRMPAGAAAGHENVDAAVRPKRAECGRRELSAKVLGQGNRRRGRSSMYPSRIRIFLVLPPDQHGHVVVDAGQARN